MHITYTVKDKLDQRCRNTPQEILMGSCDFCADGPHNSTYFPCGYLRIAQGTFSCWRPSWGKGTFLPSSRKGATKTCTSSIPQSVCEVRSGLGRSLEFGIRCGCWSCPTPGTELLSTPPRAILSTPVQSSSHLHSTPCTSSSPLSPVSVWSWLFAACGRSQPACSGLGSSPVQLSSAEAAVPIGGMLHPVVKGQSWKPSYGKGMFFFLPPITSELPCACIGAARLAGIWPLLRLQGP